MVRNLPANAKDTGDIGWIPGSRRSPGGGHSNPLQDSCLESPMDRGAWRATVHGVTKSQTRLSTNTCCLSVMTRKVASSSCARLKHRWRHGSKYMMNRQIGLPGDAVVKNLPANAGDARDVVSIPGSGRSSGVGNSNSLQYYCLETSMDREARRSGGKSGGLQSMGPQRVRHSWAHTSFV